MDIKQKNRTIYSFTKEQINSLLIDYLYTHKDVNPISVDVLFKEFWVYGGSDETAELTYIDVIVNEEDFSGRTGG